MTDKEFLELQEILELVFQLLDKLQGIYRKECGRDYVPPARVS